MYLIFDTETTGLPKNWNAPLSDTSNWPRCVQIAWQLHDEWGNLIEHKDFLITPEGYNIPYDAEKVHGISTELATLHGQNLADVLAQFNEVLEKAKFVVGQNLNFDLNILGCEFHRLSVETRLNAFPVLDTCTEKTAELCQLPGGRGGKFKLPTLTELHFQLFKVPFQEAHNATADVEATARCFFELLRTDGFSTTELASSPNYLPEFKLKNPATIKPAGLVHRNLKELSEKIKHESAAADVPKIIDISGNRTRLSEVPFSHLHNHTQFSVLQATTRIKNLVKRAVEFKSPALALTDSGNMMAAFQFVKEVQNYNKSVESQRKLAEEKGENYEGKSLIPIVGCEFNICKNRLEKTNKDNGFQVIFLAKNKRGYHNLAKMSSIAFTEGFYYLPRIDREVVELFKDDLIVLSGGINGEIPSLILNAGERQAEEALLWWKEKFGDDFYLEINRHGSEEEKRVNETLLRFHSTYGVKIVATNANYYLDKKDANAHDILLCIKDGELKSTPVGSGRGHRFGLKNNEFYFKSPEEMKVLFADLPEAIENTNEIVSKCESYGLAREILLPAFDIPEEFRDPLDAEDGGKRGENNYLRHLTYQGAEKRYGEITQELRDRLDFELATIANTGYPGYFLIVQDFCNAAREMGVSVGPGRGSAAGSAVAYCTKITNVDPIRYDLLFERFLNPERVSMPDIDIDFDDEGRQKVIDWVINKYGSKQVAQIITYGTMAAKSSIRDTARVLDLPLHEADKLAKLIPDLISLHQIINLDQVELAEKFKNNQDDLNKSLELREIAKGKDSRSEVVNQAVLLEGSMRNVGTHACGVIITPDDITNFVPVALSKDSDMYCTQFDNSVAEDAGLLKMDFLGLKTLTLIKDAVKLIKECHGIDLDPDNFPVDDTKTYELFQRGETVGIFQYESPGMQKYLRELKPTVFADLIAMNALYRPGPLEYIPSFIRRKHGTEPIVYDLDANKEYLEETYGIVVYQEQVMLLSQSLAGFSKGEADTLRKAMGKKSFDLLAKMKPKFLESGAQRGHDKKILEKMWTDWEAFASYAFNKSHSTCYAWIAYQTAYLKAHYPAEYMASVLSNNMGDIKSVSFFMEECKRGHIPVLGPDVNESEYKFTVNKAGAIRFGLGAIKGVGSKPVDDIIIARKNGEFKSIFDFASRVNLRTNNKRVFESLALAGAFDSFGTLHRAQYFSEDSSGKLFLENILRFGAKTQEGEDPSQVSLFGGDSAVETPVPEPPRVPEWPALTKLSKEKEVVGIYISGHPLDDFKLEMDSFAKGKVGDLNNVDAFVNQEIRVAGIVTDVQHRTTKHGAPFGTFDLEDYSDTTKQFLFSDSYLKFKHMLQPGQFVFISGKVQQKKYGDGYEYKINSIELLSELRERRVKSIILSAEYSDITDQCIDELYTLILAHSGNCQLKFQVKDHKNNSVIKMPSRSVKINLEKEFIDKVNDLKVFECKFE